MTAAEKFAVEALSLCRLMPGTWDKRFVRGLVGVRADTPLSPKQRQNLWRIAHRFRKQVVGRQPVFGEMIDAHLKALAEGESLPGERGRFESALSLDPEDWATRLVYADWLEDQGELLAAGGQRWQARWKKRPELCGAGAAYTVGATLPCNWEWMWNMGYAGQTPDREGASVIPYEMWEPAWVTWSKTRIAAERKLAELVAKHIKGAA